MFTISIQNPLWFKLFKVIPLPPWESSSWHHGMIASDMLLCFGRTTGWASLRESLDFLSLPLIRNKPLLSKKGSRFIHAQFIGFNFAVWICIGSPYFFPKLLKLDHINYTLFRLFQKLDIYKFFQVVRCCFLDMLCWNMLF